MTTTPRKIKIRIDVKKDHSGASEEHRNDGEFKYSHSVARVRGGDQITWWSTDGEFTLHFQQASPFEDLRISSHPAVGNKHETEAMTVLKLPVPTRCHYTVVIKAKNKDGKDETFVDSCPAVLDEC